MAQDLGSIVKDILISYEGRIKELGDKLKENGSQLIDYSKKERAHLLQELESLLARKVHLRKKDFRLMMQEIESYQMDREANLSRLMDSIKEDGFKRLQLLKEALATNPSPEAIESIDIIENPGKEKLIEEEIAEFEIERDELSLQLNRLLERADSLRIKDFKKAVKKLKTLKDGANVKEIVCKQRELEKEINELLNEFKAFQHSIGNLWQKEVMRDGDG